MKTIRYFLAASLIFMTMILSSWNVSADQKTVVLQAEAESATPALLKESSEIIKGRLDTFGVRPSAINIDEKENRISVAFDKSVDVSQIESLLTLKGNLSFYLTYNREELKSILKDERLFSLLDLSGSGIGYVTPEKTKQVDNCIESYGKISGCRFGFGMNEDSKGTSLYALITDKDGNPLMKKSDVDSVYLSDQSMIGIKFNKNARMILADATSKNIGRSFAIVIDDKVISDPVIKSAISGGSCEISGDFSKEEISFLLALVKNNPLPLNFTVVK